LRAVGEITHFDPEASSSGARRAYFATFL